MEEYIITDFPDFIQEEVVQQEAIPVKPTYSLMYAILTTDEYNALNASISEALGYPDNSGTERYAPIAEGDNVQAMPIIAEIQERFPELIAQYELVDNIPTYEVISICSEHQTPDADCERCNVTIEV